MSIDNANDIVIIINETCSICLLDIEENSTDIKLVECCKNKFHNSCYIEWINTKPTCPLCRNVHILPVYPILINARLSRIVSSQVHPVVTVIIDTANTADTPNTANAIDTLETTSPTNDIENGVRGYTSYCICRYNQYCYNYIMMYYRTIFCVTCLLVFAGFLFGVISNGHF